MGSIIIRVLVLSLAALGVYKVFPQVSKPVDYYITKPSFQTGFVKPAVNLANKVLPSKLQLPVPTAVMGVSTDASSSSPIKEISDQVAKQAADLAGEQIKQLKISATDSFCKVLIEKIQTECGKSVQP
jgi:hypothetical protein